MTVTRATKRWHLVVACCAIVVGALVGVAGCSEGTVESGAAQATGAESGHVDVQMSGGYEVGPDGKLLKPKGPEPVLPKQTEGMKESNGRGAESFARYFVGVAQYAWNSGDVTEFRAISSDECEVCNGMIQAIESRFNNGGWTRNLKYLVTESREGVEVPGPDQRYAVPLRLTYSTDGEYTGTKLVPAQKDYMLLEVQACREIDSWIACGGGAQDDVERN